MIPSRIEDIAATNDKSIVVFLTQIGSTILSADRTFTGAIVDREQAEKSLAIIRDVIENTRDDLIERNWGMIWIVHSFINFVVAVGGTWIDRNELSVFWYLVPLLAVTVLDIVTVLIFMSREQGVRSYVEWQLWGIWIAFLIFTVLAVFALHWTGTRPSLFGPIFAMNCGIAFAMMGVVFYRQFFFVGAMFAAVTLIVAAYPQYQWWVIGFAWWLAMFVPGVGAYRELKRRQNSGEQTRIL